MAEHGAVDHVDVRTGEWLYRVFLLASTLQVDLAFAPAGVFAARAPSFKLVFGEAAPPAHTAPPQPAELIGMAWLHALHARSAIARGRPWHAEYMISGVRDHVLALACVRHGVTTAFAKGVDQLPAAVTVPLATALVTSLEPAELARALRAVLAALDAEIREHDRALAERLAPVLAELAG
jgi:hypothetical protein